MAGWLTPNSVPSPAECRVLFIPGSPEWIAIVSGALLDLCQSYNWEQHGTLTPDECAAAMTAMFDQFTFNIPTLISVLPNVYEVTEE